MELLRSDPGLPRLVKLSLDTMFCVRVYSSLLCETVMVQSCTGDIERRHDF